jgi:Na+-transporting methylmalonyl-CoA/oxaloacetate decarboxylase gamma subunit
MSLTELMRVLQDFGIFVVIILLAYVIYKIGILIEVISKKIKGEKEQL